MALHKLERSLIFSSPVLNNLGVFSLSNDNLFLARINSRRALRGSGKDALGEVFASLFTVKFCKLFPG